MIDAEGRPIPTEPRPCVRSDHYRVLLGRNYIGMHATVLFRRDALERVGGFDRRLRACDDYDIYLRIARTQPAYCHDRTVAEYRWHGGNTSLNWRLMLRSTVGPLRAQRRYVRGNPDLETEYRAGRRAWQRQYGDPLLAETLGDLRKPRRWPRAVASHRDSAALLPRGTGGSSSSKAAARRSARRTGWRVHEGRWGRRIPRSKGFGHRSVFQRAGVHGGGRRQRSGTVVRRLGVILVDDGSSDGARRSSPIGSRRSIPGKIGASNIGAARTGGSAPP